MNYDPGGASRVKVFSGKGDECMKLTKENRDCVTVLPFATFSGELSICQVIFSGSGHTSHMAPEIADKNIDNLMISVNEHGVSDHATLLAAYKR